MYTLSMKLVVCIITDRFSSSRESKKEQTFTSRPKNLPIDANKCRVLLLLKLMKTSAAVMLPWFKASSHSVNTEGSRIFRDD